jgi:uncharacterized DUF497 family protein
VGIRFEWDPDKAEMNLKKHQIAFGEAATVFGDPDHSIEEQRFITVGLSRFENLLIVSHADRGDCIRIISARKVTRRERKFYEEYGCSHPRQYRR